MDDRGDLAERGQSPGMTSFDTTKQIHTQADLHALWSGLMQPLGFSKQSIWMLRIGPDRCPTSQILEIAEADEVPPRAAGHGFPEVLRLLAEDEPRHSYAFLRSRPGRGVTRDDRAWAAFLHEAGRIAGVAVEVVHQATDDELVPLPLDAIGIGSTP